MKKHDVYEFIISISKEISKKREGALFVIANTKRLNNKYSLLFPQIQKKFYISEKGSEKIIEKLATLDGAVLISDSGMLLAYGAKLKRSIPVRGHGTKHAAAAGTTSAHGAPLPFSGDERKARLPRLMEQSVAPQPRGPVPGAAGTHREGFGP